MGIGHGSIISSSYSASPASHASPALPAPHLPQSPVDINLTHSDTNR
ncbi:hypothetical protein COO91_03162 [Nostoc flagelliforme CCNUN1]|uniref:Uncharacterized protein n=1 Tax=Nostoc flagelliforme CCNUN1 TaxID=2038116 RepID=A0A2K8SP19_9NOSO|nr:hypothetical protein COO91_03162 [Nostoc flagelliforme CCNUN1]